MRPEKTNANGKLTCFLTSNLSDCQKWIQFWIGEIRKNITTDSEN